MELWFPMKVWSWLGSSFLVKYFAFTSYLLFIKYFSYSTWTLSPDLYLQLMSMAFLWYFLIEICFFFEKISFYPKQICALLQLLILFLGNPQENWFYLESFWIVAFYGSRWTIWLCSLRVDGVERWMKDSKRIIKLCLFIVLYPVRGVMFWYPRKIFWVPTLASGCLTCRWGQPAISVSIFLTFNIMTWLFFIGPPH